MVSCAQVDQLCTAALAALEESPAPGAGAAGEPEPTVEGEPPAAAIEDAAGGGDALAAASGEGEPAAAAIAVVRKPKSKAAIAARAALLAEALCMRGNARLERGRVDPAKADYLAAVRASPTSALAHYCLGSLLGSEVRGPHRTISPTRWP